MARGRGRQHLTEHSSILQPLEDDTDKILTGMSSNLKH